MSDVNQVLLQEAAEKAAQKTAKLKLSQLQVLFWPSMTGAGDSNTENTGFPDSMAPLGVERTHASLSVQCNNQTDNDETKHTYTVRLKHTFMTPNIQTQ